ncbi:hypothetical protein QFZ49_005448 [Streptomyces turgidiscabies]|uniref:Uncharacterized protein n=1 Tax=Streptomyces turgidiscabies TaxID=85558 RepID=A0ABU0RU24_9ACTN|nr:hypothetical protein [Streptomyces turgidiscabies]
MGVAGTQGAGLGLHPDGGVAPAAAHCGQDVHGVVPRVEEHSPPQVGDAVRAPCLDADQTAAGADARQLGLRDLVPQAGGECGQHCQGEECLERAGRRQFAVRVVRGEHLTGAGVGHQPRQCGHVPGESGCAGAEPGVGARAVQQPRVRRRRRRGGGAGTRTAAGGRRDRRERQHARHGQRTAGGGDPGRESDGHTANVRMDVPNAALPGPRTGPEHPDAAHGSPCEHVVRPKRGLRHGQRRLDAPQEGRVVGRVTEPLQEGLQTRLAVPRLQGPPQPLYGRQLGRRQEEFLATGA